jgi:hypothetical protein
MVARLGACDRKVRCRPPIKLTELTDLDARKALERTSAEQPEQILEPLPIVLSIVDKSIHPNDHTTPFFRRRERPPTRRRPGNVGGLSAVARYI